MSTVNLPATRNGTPPAPAAMEPGTLEALIASGDMKAMTPQQRVSYYKARCESAGLDPTAQPFQYLLLNNKLVLYATKACTDQLTGIHRLTVAIVGRETTEGVHVVQCRVTFPDGRSVEDCGAVAVGGLKGEPLANALMKATTKAKRRAVLSACGLGMLDETEAETIPNARVYEGDPPPRTSTLPEGGSPADDKVFREWQSSFAKDINAKWDDHISTLFRGEIPDKCGEVINEFQLSGHLAKWLGLEPGITYNHRLRTLALALRDRFDDVETEAKDYCRQEWSKRLAKVKRDHAQRLAAAPAGPADDDELDAPDRDEDFGDAYEENQP